LRASSAQWLFQSKIRVTFEVSKVAADNKANKNAEGQTDT